MYKLVAYKKWRIDNAFLAHQELALPILCAIATIPPPRRTHDLASYSQCLGTDVVHILTELQAHNYISGASHLLKNEDSSILTAKGEFAVREIGEVRVNIIVK